MYNYVYPYLSPKKDALSGWCIWGTVAIDSVICLNFIAVCAQLFYEWHRVSQVLILSAFDFHLHFVFKLVP